MDGNRNQPPNQALHRKAAPRRRLVNRELLACMSEPAISDADMVEIQLRKWIGRGQVHNVTLRPA